MENIDTNNKEFELILSTETQCELILNQIISNFNEILSSIKENELDDFHFKTVNDLVFFKELFIQNFGENDYEEFEVDFINKHIQSFQDEYFPVELSFSIREDDLGKYIVLKTIINGYEEELVYLSPFFKTIRIVEDLELERLIEEEEELLEGVQNLKELMDKYVQKIKHPIGTSETPLDMIGAIVKKNKKIKGYKENIVEIDKALGETKLKLTDVSISIEDRKTDSLELDLTKERVANIFINILNYNLI